MKTRREILIDDHDSALQQRIENEINIISLTRRIEKLDPGSKDAEPLQAQLEVKKTNLETVQGVIDIIEELIKKEEEN